MFDQLIREVPEPVAPITNGVKIIPAVQKTVGNGFSKHFCWHLRSPEFTKHVRATAATNGRGEDVVIIRDIGTDQCAVFPSKAEAVKAMNFCNPVTLRKRLNRPYAMDPEWQFATIRKGDRFDVRTLFPEPLVELPEGFHVMHNTFHMVFRKDNHTFMVVGFKQAMKLTKLTMQGVYNLLLKEGSPVGFSEFTGKVALMEDMRHFPHYLPREYDHIVYDSRDAKKACCGESKMVFGIRQGAGKRSRIVEAFARATPKVTKIYKPRKAA